MTTDSSFRSGDVVDRGEFGLDERRAREKLRNYRLPSPHHYILEFIKTAHLLEATTIDVDVARQEVTVDFDGQLPSKEELRKLYSAAFSSHTGQHQRAMRHLAIGVNAAFGAGLKSLTIEVGGADPFAICVDEEEVRDGHIAEGIPDGVRIRLQKRFSEAMLIRFVDQLSGGFKEARLLRERARYSRVDLVLNGTLISRGMDLSGQLQAVADFDEARERGVVGLTCEDHGFVIRLLQNGVLIEDVTRPSPFKTVGGRALVESSQLTMDLSQTSFVKDQKWDALQQRLEDRASQLLVELLEGLDEDELRKYRPDLRQMAVRVIVTMGLTQDGGEDFDDIVHAVDEMPLFDHAVQSGGGHRFISLADSRRGGRTVGTIRFIDQAVDVNPDPDPPVVLLRPDDPAFEEVVVEGLEVDRFQDFRVTFLEFFAREVTSFRDVLRDRRARRENRDRWQSRAAFEMGIDPVRHAVLGDLEVGVGIAESDLDSGVEEQELPTNGYLSRVFFVKDGRLLKKDTFVSDVAPFRIAIGGDLCANATFDAPRYDDPSLREAITEGLKFVAELLEVGDLTLGLFCSLLGDFQESLNGVFHWDWSDWPQALRDSPLGVTPSLMDADAGADRQAQLELQLQRLGSLADDRFIVSLNGNTLSLRDIYRRLYEEEAPPRLIIWRDDFNSIGFDKRTKGGVEANDLVLELPAWASTPVARFFRRKESFDAGHLDVTGRWSRTADPGGDEQKKAESSNLDVGRDDEMGLVSRLAREEHHHSGKLQPDWSPESDSSKKRRGGSKDHKIPDSNDAEQSPSDELQSGDRGDDAAGFMKFAEVTESEPSAISEASMSEEIDEVSVCELILQDLGRYAPEGLRSRIDAIDEIEIIDRCGSSPVFVVGDGNHLVFDRAHPAIDGAVRRPRDPVARAFAASEAFEELIGFDVAHGRQNWTQPKLLMLKRRFLECCCARLAEDIER